MAKPYATSITTSTTASSTTFPSNFHVKTIKNIDSTNNIIISFDATIGTSGNNEITLTPTDDTLNFDSNVYGARLPIIYWDASAGTPILQVTGFII